LKKTALQILTLLLGFIGLIYFSNLYNFRIDLTEEKRYTIAEPTKKVLKSLKNDVFVKVYLTGSDLPSGFKRLETSIKQTLDEFQNEAPGKINYRFIDIYKEYKTDEEREKIIAELAQKGITPTNIIAKKDGKSTQILLMPGAILTTESKELPVFLLKGNQSESPQETLNQAGENVEFELATALKDLTQTEKKKIGFFVNYSNLPAINQIELIKLLKKNYDLFPVDLTASPTLDGLDAVFVMKPNKPFEEADKYKLDQFIVKGGKALFFIDPVKIDTIGYEGNFAKPIAYNLEDMFFKYGIRINTNLVKDMEASAAIPMHVGTIGDKPNVKLIPWPYFPLINNFGNSIITKNLDAVLLKYASTIDTVKEPNLKKTPLLQTSSYTQILNAPATISYNSAAKDFDQNTQQAGVKTIAYLLEGTFSSFYVNAILPTDARYGTFKAIDKPSKIVICVDGDLPTNDIESKAMQPLPLGYDKYTKYTFANKEFIKNAVDYLLSPEGIINARNKTVKLRPLDKLELTNSKTKWQLINLIIPFGLLALLWLLIGLISKKKYR
jgi:ABC-2 type transport system permease protein